MIKYRKTLLWANLPEKYKTTSLNSFKTKMRTLKCETCVGYARPIIKIQDFYR